MKNITITRKIDNLSDSDYLPNPTVVACPLFPPRIGRAIGGAVLSCLLVCCIPPLDGAICANEVDSTALNAHRAIRQDAEQLTFFTGFECLGDFISTIEPRFCATHHRQFVGRNDPAIFLSLRDAFQHFLITFFVEVGIEEVDCNLVQIVDWHI